MFRIARRASACILSKEVRFLSAGILKAVSYIRQEGVLDYRKHREERHSDNEQEVRKAADIYEGACFRGSRVMQLRLHGVSMGGVYKIQSHQYTDEN